jgi:biotin synthase
MNEILEILQTGLFNRENLIGLLQTTGVEEKLLFSEAAKVKEQFVGKRVYLRGLTEFSNVCRKDCFYCGIRHSNDKVERFNLNDSQIIEAARYASEKKFGSLVLQSGESKDKTFTQRITKLLRSIHKETQNTLQITLSCGEQSSETYKEWFRNGAKRYLLRIETSNPELYCKLHPANENHSFIKRVDCLHELKKVGYQVGTGVMVGLPYQTIGDLADDLLWMRNFDVDMVGMGPYIEHADTPLFAERKRLLSLKERFRLSLKMIAILRIMMKDINIAASTAMQTADKLGREKAIKVGANVFMPNITPVLYRQHYRLYDNKSCIEETPEDCLSCISIRIGLTGNELALGEWGDSKHFFLKQKI